MSALLGKNAKSYYSEDPLTDDDGPDDLTWTEVTNIQDESDNFSAEEIDTTTRATAALGWGSVVRTVKSGEVTFGMLLEPGDVLADALMAAFLAATPITMMHLTGDREAAGSFGVAANWSVSMSFTKEVKGVQKADVSLKIQDNVNWVSVT